VILEPARRQSRPDTINEAQLKTTRRAWEAVSKIVQEQGPAGWTSENERGPEGNARGWSLRWNGV
jgi:hypothetical protein